MNLELRRAVSQNGMQPDLSPLQKAKATRHLGARDTFLLLRFQVICSLKNYPRIQDLRKKKSIYTANSCHE